MFGKFACVRQHDMVDCGAAALATVALHYRRPIGLEQIRDLTGTDRVGANLLGLLQAAQRLGFSAKGVKGTYEALPQVPLPAVAHTKTEEGLGHFVVLHRVRSTGVIVADPGRGVRKLSRDEFCRRWTGYLLLADPSRRRPPRPGGSRRPPPGGDSCASWPRTRPCSWRPLFAPCS
jgi:ATP-binding cassette subfamily B protein